MNIHSVQYVSIKENLSEEEYETFCQLVTNDFTWGDTDIVLVSKGRLFQTLVRRTSHISGYQDVLENELANKLRKLFKDLPSSTFFAL